MRTWTISWIGALGVAGAAGCEQLLGVDAYQERTTGSTTTTGAGGAGGGTMSTTNAGSTSTGTMPDPCFDARDAVYPTGAQVIAGYQGRCTQAQLDALGTCWLGGDLECTAFYADPANADCSACVRGTPSSATVPALMSAFGVRYYYIQVIACEAVAEQKEHCIEAVELEFCRVTACEGCYDDDAAYDDCASYAYETGCSSIELPADCESVFTTFSPECWSQSLPERLVDTAAVLCGAP